MRKLIAGIIVGLGLNFVQAEEKPTLIIDDLSGGIFNRVDSTIIPDNTVSDARNVYFDKETVIEKRKGMSVLNDTQLGASGNRSVKNQYNYKRSDGYTYHIAVSSNSLYYRLSSAEFTSFDSGVSTDNVTNFSVFMDTLNYVNGSDNLTAWDTSSTWEQTASYQFRYLIVWQNRLWGGGDDDELSGIRSCAFQDPKDWDDTQTLATSSVYIDVNSSNGQDMVGFFLSPNGNLGILKEKSVWEIGGYDKDDFYLRLVIADIGCVDSGGVSSRRGIITWLSSEGIIAYDGNTYSIVSKPIQYTVDSIQQLQPNSGMFRKDVKSDWETNTHASYIDSSTYPGSIVNDYKQSFTGDDTTFSTYETHISKNSDGNIDILARGTDTSAGQTGLCVSTYNYTSKILSASKIVTTDFYNNNIGAAGKYMHNSYDNDSSDNKYIIHYDLGGTDVMVSSYTASLDTWGTETICSNVVQSLSDKTGLALDIDSSGVAHIVFSSMSVTNPLTKIGVYYSSYTSTGWSSFIEVLTKSFPGSPEMLTIKVGGGIIHVAYYHDRLSGDSIVYSSMTVGGSSFSGYSTLPFVPPSPNTCSMDLDSSNNPHIGFHVQSVSDFYISIGSHTPSVGWSFTPLFLFSEQTTGFGNKMKIDSNDDIHLIESGFNYDYFYDVSAGTTTSRLYDSSYLTLSGDFVFDSEDRPILVKNGNPLSNLSTYVFITTSTYISQIYDTGFDTYTFGSFIADTNSSDYDNYHYLRSSDTASNIAGESWTQVTNNSIPTLSGYKHLQYKLNITTGIVSENYTKINRVTINYSSDEDSVRLTSMLYDDRVWLGVSISSATALDRILVNDTNRNWTFFNSNIQCMSLLNYNGVPYMGSDDGYVYQLDITNADSGNAIDAYVTTKDYDLGNSVIQKTIDKTFFVGNEQGNWNLNIDYYLDKNSAYTETFPIDLDETSNLINYKLPIRERNRFYTIQYKIYNSNADEPFDMLGLYSIYRSYPLR